MFNDPLSWDPEACPSLWRKALGLPLLAYRCARWRALRGGWLPGYWRRPRFDRRRFPEGAPIDILVMVADHYEPARRYGDEAAIESVRSWCTTYEEITHTHRDADGRYPQHTWFYRYDYPNPGCVQELSRCTFRGFGEVEFHLHHGHDTHDAVAATLQNGLDWFNRFGAMIGAEAKPRPRFGYVAGNSALDNGAGDDSLSGCDTEIRALAEAGCYADFTFPALGSPAQPKLTNTIYYATEDGQAKSYNDGVEVAVGRPPSGDLMIFQGPVSVDWRAGCVADGAIENSSPPHPSRLAPWLSAHVHVAGRPEWVFVKLHTHAMQNRASFLSQGLGDIFAAMEAWWNRPPFRLHYVTAREAYNIVKAAEAGHSGNPNDYRDWKVPPPANRAVLCDRPWRLRTWTAQRVHLDVLESGPVNLELATGPLHSVTGHVRELEAVFDRGKLAHLRIEGDGEFDVQHRDGPESDGLSATHHSEHLAGRV